MSAETQPGRIVIDGATSLIDWHGQTDPNGRDPHQPGVKLDAGKAPVMRGALQYFPRALVDVALLSQFGANKYAWKGWESVPDGVNRYGDALARHMVYEEIEGPIDSETGLHHATAMAWNALARLELILRQRESQ